MSIFLAKEKLQHLNSVVHEGKVVICSTDSDGKIWYTVKQEGFEDSYLEKPAEERTGWEDWKELEFPDERDSKQQPKNDASVAKKEKAELTYKDDDKKFILRSRYQTKTESQIAPVQLLSALGHIYVFRQSKSNTLLVDRFVLDGMTNTLNRKLEVRFKRSQQKHEPTKSMKKEGEKLTNIDTLDYRDANGNFFYEPTTELCLVNNLKQGWFSVVLVPTVENDIYRWHIFAYNSQSQKVEITTIRASQEGLFDVKDYIFFEESQDTPIPRKIPGIIKRVLDIKDVTVANGLAATKYDLQQEQETQSGEKQLLKTATRIMLAIPTHQGGTAAFSFAIGKDGILAQIGTEPNSTIIRSQQREVLLPLNILDEIKAYADKTPPPQGIITGFAEGTAEEKIKDLVKILTQEKIEDLVKIPNDGQAKLAIGDIEEIAGRYRIRKASNKVFHIVIPPSSGLSLWEQKVLEELESNLKTVGLLMFEGMLSSFQASVPDVKLTVFSPENHGLENDDEVQIAIESGIVTISKISTNSNAPRLTNGDLVKITVTTNYQGIYQTKKVDNHSFEIDLPSTNGLGFWEKQDQEESSLIFDGMITAYQKTADGKLRITCPNHSLEDGDEVQITATEDYNNTYPVRKIDNTYFVIERKWVAGEAINVKRVSEKRRGLVFDGVDDYISLSDMNHDFSQGITVEAWVWFDSFQDWSRIIDFGNGEGADNITFNNNSTRNALQLSVFNGNKKGYIVANNVLETGKWIHIAATIDVSGSAKIYKNGIEMGSHNGVTIQTEQISLPRTIKRTKNYIGKSNWNWRNPKGYFHGKISDVRIWNKARTAEEIKNNMYLQLRGTEAGLVGYWRLGGISEGKVIDFSVNGNDGTVHGHAYVSAAILKRKLADKQAVKYSNPELFAVSNRATYQESFEFKVNRSTPVNLNYLNNADGKGNRIFTLSYWGKSSQSAEKETTISSSSVEQNKFADLGNGWYKASANLTIPDQVSLLRSFEIANITGEWDSLEIRNHCIRFLSDSITENKYTDNVSLTILSDNQAKLAENLEKLVQQEQKEAILFQEKIELEYKLGLLNNSINLKAQLDQQKQIVAEKRKIKDSLYQAYQKELNNPFNYYCLIKLQDNYRPEVKHRYIHAETGGNNRSGARIVSWSFGDPWQFIPQANGTYLIKLQDNYRPEVKHRYIHGETGGSNSSGAKIVSWSFGDPCQLIKGEVSNRQIIENAKIIADYAEQEYKLENTKLLNLEKLANTKEDDKNILKARLTLVIQQRDGIKEDLRKLNNSFLEGVKDIQNTPQTMSKVAEDGRELVTQAALLKFVNPVSRLSAIETCEGKVQLSYFDAQGRIRQVSYDTTVDEENNVLKQWIPDVQRACLNFSDNHSVLTLKESLHIPENWTIEAWFFYPLPETGEWNTLIRGKDNGHHIIVRNGKQLGTHLYVQGGFFDSGYNMELLSPGWHHIAAVGQGNTTLFYIDGEKVGDIQAKALADAEKNLKKEPNNETAKKKFEDTKKAILKVTNSVYAIGNYHEGRQQFGKIAEVRIWGVALSREEIAVSSKTLLNGNEPGLLAYYPMNEAKGNEVRDHSGNGNNGQISDATKWWACAAPIGNSGNRVMKFNGISDYISISDMNHDFSQGITVEAWVWYDRFKDWSRIIDVGNGQDADNIILTNFSTTNTLEFSVFRGKTKQLINATGVLEAGKWIHVAATIDVSGNARLYKNGQQIKTGTVHLPNQVKRTNNYIGRSNWSNDSYFNGKITDIRIWNKARTQADIQADMHKRLNGKEPNLLLYYPLNGIKLQGDVPQILDQVGNYHGRVNGAIPVYDNTIPIGGDALVCNEYSAITLENSLKVAIMRRFFGYPTINGAALLPDKRIEAVELKWIGNAQFKPTLLGYIEGAPPVPSENLTIADDYNGATFVELTTSEDMSFSWNRSQDAGFGGTIAVATGVEEKVSVGLGVEKNIEIKGGWKGESEYSYQLQNQSNIVSSSSLSTMDRLELRGTPEEIAKFPHLGNRFIPKNVGYALVVSGLADVFITKLARSGKMIGYQVQPVDGIPLDVNTITFLINPAYTMNGSLDGLTGGTATSNRFFRHVPEMRSQYGSLYPASYYRLQEAYNLKRQIEAEDKRRESYFYNFNVHWFVTLDGQLSNHLDSGDQPNTIGMGWAVDETNPELTEQERANTQRQQSKQIQTEARATADVNKEAAEKKQAEIQRKIEDQETRVQATAGFAAWQRRMEDIQIRAGKRNIVNTYVWDADGGLRTEAQSFANTVEHTIGGSSTMKAAFGTEISASVSVSAELTLQGTINLTQTMNKTQARSKGFQLNVDLSGLEHRGITNHDNKPIQSGEKVKRYRFMSFYLEGSTQHFNDFFGYVVDPEWLQSNSEEARALRQAQVGKPNKAWRVLHRVTYVERPALIGFGRDVRKLPATAESSENQQLLEKIADLEKKNRKLEEKLDQVLDLLQPKTNK